jgi:hypothetical protein
LYGNRQSVVGGTAELRYKTTHVVEIRKAIEDLKVVFEKKSLSAADTAALCSRWRIDYLFVRSVDPVWNKPDSWIWSTPVAYANPGTRIYACSSESQPGPSVGLGMRAAAP